MQSVKDAANALVGKVKEVTSIVTNETTKVTKNESLSPVDDKSHEVKKDATEQRGVIGQIGGTISNAYHFVAEKVQEAANVVSFDTNKDKTKDATNTVSERNNTGFPTTDDKIDDKCHQVNAEDM